MLRSILLLYCYFIVLLVSHGLDEELLLCKYCGHAIAHIKHINFVKSDQAVKTWQDKSLFKTRRNGQGSSLKAVPTVQLIRNSFGSEFNMITVTQANMRLMNRTTTMRDTWFPKFKWTIGVCPQCMNHIGWYYESVESGKGFFGLVADYIFKEDEAEELVMMPRLKMN